MSALLPPSALLPRPLAPSRPVELRADTLARVERSRPRSADAHVFERDGQAHLLLPDGSRIYDIADAWRRELAEAEARGDVARMLAERGLAPRGYIDDEPPKDFALRALSLAVAQRCNLGCGYCYAQGGDFGAPAASMTWEVARSAVDRLLADAAPGDRVTLAFLGGEPLVNRDVVHRATRHLAERAAERGVRAGFSITTNGTLLDATDAALFAQHGFSVTLSLDAVGDAHDRLRPFKNGRGSYAAVLDAVRPLLDGGLPIHARVTVTPENLSLRETLDAFVAMGFAGVGFSPMLASPTGRHELDRDGLLTVLEQMIDCGREFERRTLAGAPYPFTNLTSALEEIHRGTHRPYPCGAGAGYFGVSASGGLYACHRFVERDDAAMGDVEHGLDDRREAWLRERHVHRQEPCRSCWARYLCGGGCHHEVIERGRVACDYVRSWLDFCLETYVRVQGARPELFARGLAAASCGAAAPPRTPPA